MSRPRPLGLVFLAVLALAWVADGQPGFVPADPPLDLVQGDSGRTTVAVAVGDDAWTVEIARSVTGDLDVAVVATSDRPFAVRARVRVAPSLFPLRAAVEVGSDRISVLAALCLGPLRLVADRAWGDETSTRIALHAAGRDVAAAASVAWSGWPRFVVSATWFPQIRPLAAVSFAVAHDGCRITLGATW